MHQQLTIIAELLQQMVWTARADGSIDFVCPRWRRYVGQTDDSTPTRTWVDALHDEDRAGAWVAWEEAVAKRQPLGIEARLKRTDGLFHRFSIGARPVLDEKGNVNRWVGVLVDLNDQKLCSDPSHRSKTDFLATLSHELRTPLTPVLATVTALRASRKWPSELAEELDMIARNIQLEARLIDDLLDLTHVTNGRARLSACLVDANAVLRAAIEVAQRQISAKQLKLAVFLEAEQHQVWADPIRLQQILWNLISNAIKFTPPGGQIAIRTQNRVAENRNGDGRPLLTIEFTDNGIGIEPSRLPLIFNAFEQRRGPRVEQLGSLGVGLAITRALLAMHGGEIRALSQGLGFGSTFTVSLPTVSGAAQDSKQAESPSRPLRILLVEDHDGSRLTVSRLLRSLGHDVTAAPNCRCAMDAIASKAFDLLISDLCLPDGTGLELMRYASQNQNTRGICISGLGMDDDLRRSSEAGFAAHLTKPITFQALEAAIRHAAPREPACTAVA